MLSEQDRGAAAECSLKVIFLNRSIILMHFHSISVTIFKFTTFVEVADIKSLNVVELRYK